MITADTPYEVAKTSMDRIHALMDTFEKAVNHFISTDYGPELAQDKKIAFAAFEDNCDLLIQQLTADRLDGPDDLKRLWPDLKVREDRLIDRIVKLRLRIRDEQHPEHVGAIMRRTYRAVVGR